MVLSKVEKPAIEAVLAEASAAKLKELAKNYYVKGYSKMNKPALVQAVSAALREPGRMEELLYIIDQPAFLLFQVFGHKQRLFGRGFQTTVNHFCKRLLLRGITTRRQ